MLDYLFLVGAVKGPLPVTELADGLDQFPGLALVAHVVVIFLSPRSTIHAPALTGLRKSASSHHTLDEPASRNARITLIAPSVAFLKLRAMLISILTLVFSPGLPIAVIPLGPRLRALILMSGAILGRIRMVDIRVSCIRGSLSGVEFVRMIGFPFLVVGVSALPTPARTLAELRGVLDDRAG